MPLHFHTLVLWLFFLDLLFLLMCLYVSACMYERVYGCCQKAEEGAGFPGAGVTCGCDFEDEDEDAGE